MALFLNFSDKALCEVHIAYSLNEQSKPLSRWPIVFKICACHLIIFGLGLQVAVSFDRRIDSFALVHRPPYMTR